MTIEQMIQESLNRAEQRRAKSSRRRQMAILGKQKATTLKVKQLTNLPIFLAFYDADNNEIVLSATVCPQLLPIVYSNNTWRVGLKGQKADHMAEIDSGKIFTNVVREWWASR